MLCLNRKGQSAFEFMVMMAMTLLVFTIVFGVYYNNVTVADETGNTLSATQLCLELSSRISSFTAMGGSSEYTLSLPEKLNGMNYTVWILSDSHRITVDYETPEGRKAGASCPFQAYGLTDGNGSAFFMLEKNATIINSGGSSFVQ